MLIKCNKKYMCINLRITSSLGEQFKLYLGFLDSLYKLQQIPYLLIYLNWFNNVSVMSNFARSCKTA